MIQANLAGIELRFETAPSLFSPTKVDRGSLAMLSCISFEPNDKVLDLGCGYGPIGVYAAKVIGAGRVWMADNDQTAIECSIKNLALNGVEGVTVVASDGFRDIREANFTKIVCNLPTMWIFPNPSTSSRRDLIGLSWAARCTSSQSARLGTKTSYAAYSVALAFGKSIHIWSSKR